MICRICNIEIKDRFYKHLNNRHHVSLKDYFIKNPDQKDEYDASKPPHWNKGKTKYTHPSIMKYSMAIKKYTNQPSIKKERSERLKRLYKERGDILSKEDRKRVVKIGSDAWVKKVKESTPEERKALLSNFTTAGNNKQKEQRVNHTPEDYERLYPWAKGRARWHPCDYCGKLKIAWFGGKPRPRKRFCSIECRLKFHAIHPCIMFVGEYYYSNKMQSEFYLRSKLELHFANLFERHEKIFSWTTAPFHITYIFEGKIKKYYPDFLINDKYCIEVKSGYVASLEKEKLKSKLQAAENYCRMNNLEFIYWQFNDPNLTEKKVCNDERIRSFFEQL